MRDLAAIDAAVVHRYLTYLSCEFHSHLPKTPEFKGFSG